MTQFARVAPEKQLVFAATGASFLSATLLFSIQPMFTKMVLPVLGGGPSTWSVAMVFFQGALLLGYAYAHLLTRYLPFKLGAIVHARGSADLDTLRSIKGWEPLRAAQRKHPWTDDYSTILEPLIDMWRRNRS